MSFKKRTEKMIRLGSRGQRNIAIFHFRNSVAIFWSYNIIKLGILDFPLKIWEQCFPISKCELCMISKE